MSEPSETAQVRLDFRFDASGEVYVAAFLEADGVPVATIRIPRSSADRTVLEAAQLTLELRHDGTVAVYADATDLGTLVSVPIGRLVAEALALMAPEDVVAELASLETVLVAALAAVRKERETRNPVA